MPLASCPQVYAQPPQLLEVDLLSGRYAGLPVHWGAYDAALLEPTGYLRLFDQQEVRGHRLLPNEFAPQSLPAAKTQLQSELGKSFETFVSGPYVIATPVGQSQRWRDRFNALLAGYVRYFEVRGWPLRTPDFPLCVIVFPTRGEFLAYTSSQTRNLPTGVVGSYFPKSNRCVLYQIDNHRGTDWNETEATIVHEAVHQLAYNTGIHERLSSNPVWFVEGLATMFEQPAVYDLRTAQSTIVGRMLPDRVARLRPVLADRTYLPQYLQDLVTSDDLFRQDAQLAYDLSWALCFYLAERMPTEFREFYTLLSRRPFGSYSAGERSQDFRRAFGPDLDLLAIQLQRLFSASSR